MLSSFVQLSTSHDIVRYSLLSLSASHLGWITRSSDLDNIAAQHQTSAYSALQKAVNTFTQANADAVFAASIILSWQAQDWLVFLRGNRRTSADGYQFSGAAGLH